MVAKAHVLVMLYAHEGGLERLEKRPCWTRDFNAAFGLVQSFPTRPNMTASNLSGSADGISEPKSGLEERPAHPRNMVARITAT